MKRSGVKAPSSDTHHLSSMTSPLAASTPAIRPSLLKKYSAPLSRHKDEEVRLSTTQVPQTLEQTLLKELEDNLKFSEKSESGLISDLKTVRRVLQTYIRENPRSRSFLTRIWTFYEETALRLQREVDMLSKQISKLADDKALLEKALIQVTEKQLSRNTQPAKAKQEPEVKKVVRATSVTNLISPSKPAQPVTSGLTSTQSQQSLVAPAKPKPKVYTRPRSVPRLNLDPILKGRGSESFLVPHRDATFVQDL